jgi:YegS/Rv2252/BmrU family lipid kinase
VPEPLLVLANRYAGALARRRGSSPLEEYGRAAGIEVEIVPTRNAAELQEILREQVAGRRDRVAVAGGDGTIHAAVQVLAKTDVALGILPLGTANNFATALRLPIDLPSAFRVIAEGEALAVSLGEADGEYFTEAAGVGLFADALALCGSGTTTKSLLRTLAAVGRLWIRHRPHQIELVLDGEERVEEAVMVTVANSFRLGLAIAIAPTARLTDTELDVVVLGALTRGELIPYFRAIRAQSHTMLPKVRHYRAREVTIRSDRTLNVHVDDRVHCRTPVTLHIVPEALRVFVDRL